MKECLRPSVRLEIMTLRQRLAQAYERGETVLVYELSRQIDEIQLLLWANGCQEQAS